MANVFSTFFRKKIGPKTKKITPKWHICPLVNGWAVFIHPRSIYAPRILFAFHFHRLYIFLRSTAADCHHTILSITASIHHKKHFGFHTPPEAFMHLGSMDQWINAHKSLVCSLKVSSKCFRLPIFSSASASISNDQHQ